MDEAEGKSLIIESSSEMDLCVASHNSPVGKVQLKRADDISERISNAIIEDSPESPEPERTDLLASKINDVVTINDTPESPSGNEDSDIQFLESHSVTRSMRVRVESNDDKNEGLGFVIDRDGLQPDPIPVYHVESKGAINTNTDSDSEEEKPGGLCKKMKKNPKAGPKCFNCGGDHMISNCPEPRDPRRIYSNIKMFKKNSDNQGKNCRYHEDQDQKYSNLKPGLLSESLRAALGLSRCQLPRHIYNMRAYGYPPGWKEQALNVGSTLKLYGTAAMYGNTNSSTVSPSRVHSYPGFNIPVPDGYMDESRYFKTSSYSSKHCRERFINELLEEQKRKKNERDDENPYLGCSRDGKYGESSKRGWKQSDAQSESRQDEAECFKRRRMSTGKVEHEDRRSRHYEGHSRRNEDGPSTSSSRHAGSSRWDNGREREVARGSSSFRGANSNSSDVGRSDYSSHCRSHNDKGSSRKEHTSSDRSLADKGRDVSGGSVDIRRSPSRSSHSRDPKDTESHRKIESRDVEKRLASDKRGQDIRGGSGRQSRDRSRKRERLDRSPYDNRRVQSLNFRKPSENLIVLKERSWNWMESSRIVKVGVEPCGAIENQEELGKESEILKGNEPEGKMPGSIDKFTAVAPAPSSSSGDNSKVAIEPLSDKPNEEVPILNFLPLSVSIVKALRRKSRWSPVKPKADEKWESASDPGVGMCDYSDFTDSDEETSLLRGFQKEPTTEPCTNSKAPSTLDSSKSGDSQLNDESTNAKEEGSPSNGFFIDKIGANQSGESESKMPDVFIYKNFYEELPTLDKFAVGMTELLLHETDEEHVGRFQQVLSILSKRNVTDK